jgi:hypothetical protein
VRPLIPPEGPGGSAYVKTVPDTTVVADPPGVRILPAATLAPIRLSVPFIVYPEQFDDLASIAGVAIRAGSDLAAAEDAILLYGANAPVVLAGLVPPIPFSATDDSGTLAGQRGLAVDPPPGPIARPVDDSIRAAITALRVNMHRGPFCVVLSPDLHEQANTPIGGTAVTRITPILPQLQKVQFSPVLPPRTGVVFSVGGGAIDLVTPWDVHVECRNV